MKVAGREKYFSHYPVHGAHWKAITGICMNTIIYMSILHMT